MVSLIGIMQALKATLRLTVKAKYKPNHLLNTAPDCYHVFDLAIQGTNTQGTGTLKLHQKFKKGEDATVGSSLIKLVSLDPENHEIHCSFLSNRESWVKVIKQKMLIMFGSSNPGGKFDLMAIDFATLKLDIWENDQNFREICWFPEHHTPCCLHLVTTICE